MGVKTPPSFVVIPYKYFFRFPIFLKRTPPLTHRGNDDAGIFGTIEREREIPWLSSVIHQFPPSVAFENNDVTYGKPYTIQSIIDR